MSTLEIVNMTRAREIYDDKLFLSIPFLNFYNVSVPDGCIGMIGDTHFCLAPEDYVLWYRPIWLGGCGHLNTPSRRDSKEAYLASITCREMNAEK